MIFLPIVERELREGARRHSTRYVRLAVTAAALLIGLFQVALMPALMRGGGGRGAFAIMTGYVFALCLLAGIFITADCLCEEKRAGTLGLLFLTDLRGYDIVLGKLASQLVHLGYGLLAVIPAAALPLLLGGVTGGEVWRISLALLNLLFFSLATGILASSLCRKAGSAMVLTALLQAFGCLALSFTWVSPTQAYLSATGPSLVGSSGTFWKSLGLSHAAAWLLVGLASVRLPRSWQDTPATNEPVAVAPISPVTQAPGVPPPVPLIAPSRRNRDLLNSDPLLWLMGDRSNIRVAIWVIAILWSLLTAAVVTTGSWNGLPAMLGLGWVGLFIVKLIFAFEACRFFVETRRAGAFELLLATPLDTNTMVSTQWRALRQTFGPPLLGVVAAVVCVTALAILLSGDSAESVFDAGLAGALGIGFVALVQVLDFFALGWLGMWLALTMRKPHLAAGATILCVLILPDVTMCYASFAGLVLDIILIAVFASKLRLDFRQILVNRRGITTPTPVGG